MDQFLQTFSLLLQVPDKISLLLIVSLEVLEMPSGGGDGGSFRAVLGDGVIRVLDVDAGRSGSVEVPAGDFGGKVADFRLQFVAVAALDEVVGGLRRRLGGGRLGVLSLVA